MQRKPFILMSIKLSLARFQKPASRGMDVQFTMPWSSPVSMSASHFGLPWRMILQTMNTVLIATAHGRKWHDSESLGGATSSSAVLGTGHRSAINARTRPSCGSARLSVVSRRRGNSATKPGVRLPCLQEKAFMQRLATANYLEHPSSCGSRGPQIGGPIPPQGH